MSLTSKRKHFKSLQTMFHVVSSLLTLDVGLQIDNNYEHLLASAVHFVIMPDDIITFVSTDFIKHNNSASDTSQKEDSLHHRGNEITSCHWHCEIGINTKSLNIATAWKRLIWDTQIFIYISSSTAKLKRLASRRNRCEFLEISFSIFRIFNQTTKLVLLMGDDFKLTSRCLTMMIICLWKSVVDFQSSRDGIYIIICY